MSQEQDDIFMMENCPTSPPLKKVFAVQEKKWERDAQAIQELSFKSDSASLRQPRINLLANAPFERHSPRYHLSESPSWYGELLTPPNPLSVLSPNNGTIHAGSTPQSSKDDTSMPRDHLTDEQNLNAQSVIGVTTCGGQKMLEQNKRMMFYDD